MPQELFSLKFEYDDPRFSQFSFPEDAPSYFGNPHLSKDFDSDNAGKLDWNPHKLADVWEPQKVIGDVAGFCDYPTVDNKPAFSARAVAVLRDLLEPCGELLPLLTPIGEYFAFNIQVVSDALDRERSNASLGDPGSSKETAFGIKHFIFNESLLGDHAIFRVREYPPMVVVSDQFKTRAEDAGLNGLHFAKIWPYAADESWDDIDRQLSRKRKREGKLAELRGQSVEIKLTISDEPKDYDEPTEEQYRNAFALADKIKSAFSKLGADTGGFMGTVSSVDPGEQGFSINIVCPDAQEAFQVCEPILRSTKWPFPMDVIIVPGNPYDRKVKPQIIEIV
ncbi:imm11 family protein [Roseiconus lacunae]|uniref:imm11 family protein n=1 Tax=Roseiconus lacunae TaxID=2605694 RepID=UPI0011F30D3B|nr:DUF1629 domain-containing protein [Roseiconus lacunae]